MNETRPILGLSGAHLITDIYSPVLPAILPLLILENGYPYLVAGIIITVWNLSSSFTQPVIGYFHDRKSFTIPLGLGVLFAAVFIPLVGLVENYYLMLLFAALGGLGHAFFHPTALSMVSRIAGDSRRGRLTAYFTVGGNLGFAIGPIIAGVVVSLFGLKCLILIVIPGVLAAGLLHLLLPPAVSARKPAVLHQPATPTSGRPPYAGVALLVIASAFRAWVIFSSVAFLPTYLAESGFDVVTANLLVSAMLLAGVVGQLVGGTVSDRYGRKEYTLVGLVASLVPFSIFLSTSGVIAVVALVVFGFCLWSTFSVTVAMAHEMVPGEAGLVSGLMIGLAVGAGGAGVAIIGYLADPFSLLTALSVLTLPILAAVVLFALVPYPWKIAGRFVSSHR
jgi:FSR family fosmidomycin resistance protein-like MFS transporter